MTLTTLVGKAFPHRQLRRSCAKALDHAGTDGFLASLPELVDGNFFPEFYSKKQGIVTRFYTANSGEVILRMPDGQGVVVVIHGVMSTLKDIEHFTRPPRPEEIEASRQGILPDGTHIPYIPFADFIESPDTQGRRFGIILDYEETRETVSAGRGYVDFNDFANNKLFFARVGGQQRGEKLVEKIPDLDELATGYRNDGPFNESNPDQPDTNLLHIGYLKESDNFEGINGYGQLEDGACFVAVRQQEVNEQVTLSLDREVAEALKAGRPFVYQRRTWKPSIREALEAGEPFEYAGKKWNPE
ncbi:TPA: hypothetical protein HA241_01465 [Candidatus Woesearchaeota archaeon]|nr:hypothetical protein [Candidatus Woesearchaeota archaeon]